jgi:hypothetical protein
VRALAAYLAVVSNQTSLLFDLQLAIVDHLFTYLSKEKREIFGVPCRSAPFPSVHSVDIMILHAIAWDVIEVCDQ